jgi:outer membrane murein-binding lipoprotein Lpp
MTTHTKGPLPGTVSGGSGRPDHTPGRVVTLRKAVVLGALVALLVGVLSAAGATYVAGGQAGELEGSVDTLNAQVDSLTTQVDDLTAEAGTLTARIESLVAEKADLADTLTGTRAQAESLGVENEALRAQVSQSTPGEEPPAAEVTYGKVFRVDRRWVQGSAFLLVVDVTATNPDAEKEAYVHSGDFRLKGLDDTLYLLADRSPVGSLSDYRQWLARLSETRNPLRYQLQVPPSEAAKACLVFYVNRAVSSFTLTYRGTSTALTL